MHSSSDNRHTLSQEPAHLLPSCTSLLECLEHNTIAVAIVFKETLHSNLISVERNSAILSGFRNSFLQISTWVFIPVLVFTGTRRYLSPVFRFPSALWTKNTCVFAEPDIEEEATLVCRFFFSSLRFSTLQSVNCFSPHPNPWMQPFLQFVTAVLVAAAGSIILPVVLLTDRISSTDIRSLPKRISLIIKNRDRSGAIHKSSTFF